MSSASEEIKNRLNIVDVLGEYLKLEKSGSNWKARCPFHNEKTPSFMVSEEKQIWHCFGCAKGGDLFTFIMDMEGLDFREALKLLAEKASVDLSQYQYKNVNLAASSTSKKSRTLEILDLSNRFYQKQLWEGLGKVKILDYLKNRGLGEETIKEFGIGYAPSGWRNMMQFLLSRGYSADEVEKTGLVVTKTPCKIATLTRGGQNIVKSGNNNDIDAINSSLQNNQENQDNNANSNNVQQSSLSSSNCYDRFRDRIMFPIQDVMGKVVGFSARVAPGGDESQAKYINTPETEAYHKSKIMYGIDKAKQVIKSEDFVLVVEGQMDVIACHNADIKNTVAVSGTALTVDQIKILKRYTKNIKLLFDMDEAGREATIRSAKICFSEDINVSVVTLPSGKDAADLANQNVEELKKVIKNSLFAIDYFFGETLSKYNKNNPSERKEIANHILDLVFHLDNQVEKAYWIKKLAQELETEEKVFYDFLQKMNEQQRKYDTNKYNQDNNQTGEEIEVNTKNSKEEVIKEKMLTLLLFQKEARDNNLSKIKKETKDFLEQDALFSILKTEPKSYEDVLMNISDPFLQKKVEKLYLQFNKTFSFSEETPLNWNEYFSDLNKALEKEIYKKKLLLIEADMKKAYQNKDEQGVKFLRKEKEKVLEVVNN